MKKIYIITTYTGTVLSYLIRKISKTPYAHVSIALNEELNPMYSFGRLNPKTPIFAGFVEEKIDEGLYAIRKNTMCRVYSLDVTDLQYNNIYNNIMFVSENRKKYDYESKKEPETVYGKKIFLPVYSNLNNLSDPCCIFKYLFYGKCRSGKA